jgi:hypothetical protein
MAPFYDEVLPLFFYLSIAKTTEIKGVSECVVLEKGSGLGVPSSHEKAMGCLETILIYKPTCMSTE